MVSICFLKSCSCASDPSQDLRKSKSKLDANISFCSAFEGSARTNLFAPHGHVIIRILALISTTPRISINYADQDELLSSVRGINLSGNNITISIVKQNHIHLLLDQRPAAVPVAGADGRVDVAIRAEHGGRQQLRHQQPPHLRGQPRVEDVADITRPETDADKQLTYT